MPTKYIDNPTDIKLNGHDEVNQILGRTPGWLLQYGIGCILLFFGILFALSYLIKYPDEIPARVQIITENPAIKVMARVSGKLNKLLVSNNQEIEEGAVIGIIDNPASLEDINTLDVFLKQIQDRTNNQLLATPLPENLNLGNIQFRFAALKQKINDLRYFKNSNDVNKKIGSLEKQIELKDQLSANLKNQKTTVLQEIEISNLNLDRNKKLYKDRSVSMLELEKIQAQILQQQRQLDMLDNQMVNNDISKEELRAFIIDLRQGRKDGSSDRQLNVAEDIESIKSEIALWKQTYLLTAPISGRVSFSNVFSEQQFVNANQEVLTIVPQEGNGKMVARALLPISNSGKVTTGQRVNIQLDGFPYTEFGIVVAEVGAISLVPMAASGDFGEESYLVDIKLSESDSDTLWTTYGKTIPFRQEMKGTANIITEDRRIVVRILDRVLNLGGNG